MMGRIRPWEGPFIYFRCTILDFRIKDIGIRNNKLLSKNYIFSIDPPRLRRVPPNRGDARRAGGLFPITIVIVLGGLITHTLFTSNILLTIVSYSSKKNNPVLRLLPRGNITIFTAYVKGEITMVMI